MCCSRLAAGAFGSDAKMDLFCFAEWLAAKQQADSSESKKAKTCQEPPDVD